MNTLGGTTYKLINMNLIIPKHNILNKISLFYNLNEYHDKRYPNSIFYHKNGKIYFELNTKNKNLWCDYELVWRVFSEEYTLEYTETQNIIKNWVEQHTNCESVTPPGAKIFGYLRVEQHTNCESVTPISYPTIFNIEVEQHTNWGSVTPSSRFRVLTLRWNNIQIK